MKLSKMFPSKWLASDDLAGHTPTVTIDRITVERVGAPPQDEDKFVMWFRGKDKGLILNKTNGVSVGGMYGDETDNWMGKDIQLYTTKVKAFGAVHDAIRIRSAGTVSAAPMPEQPAEPEDVQDWGDEDPVPESLADAPPDPAAGMGTPEDNPFNADPASDDWGDWSTVEVYPMASAWGEERGKWNHKKHFSAAWTKTFVATDAGKPENAAAFLAEWRDVVNAHVADVEAAA